MENATNKIIYILAKDTYHALDNWHDYNTSHLGKMLCTCWRDMSLADVENLVKALKCAKDDTSAHALDKANTIPIVTSYISKDALDTINPLMKTVDKIETAYKQKI